MTSEDRRTNLALAGIFCVYLIAQIPLWGYVTDDTYIHLVYARNLLLGKGWVFNVGEPSYGSTSPLWVLLLTPVASSEGAGILAARLMGIAAGLASIWVFFQLAARCMRRREYILAATLLFASEVWFLRWSASGMESSLTVLVLLLFFHALATVTNRNGSFFGVGLLAGLCGLTRPEYYLLIGITLVLALFSRRWRRKWWAFTLGVGVLMIPWLLFAHFQLGGMFPSTAAAKSRSFQGWEHLMLQIWRLLKVPLSSQGPLLLVALIGGGSFLLGRPCRRPHPGLVSRSGDGRIRFYSFVALVWGVALPAVFILRDVQIISRYLLPVTPLLPLTALYFLDLWSDRRPRLKLAVPLIMVLTLIPNLWLMTTRVIPYVKRFPAELELSLGSIADYLHSSAPPSSSVAAPDIGLLGFRSGCNIVDLGGLIHPEIAAHWHRSGYREMVERLEFLDYQQADYLVDRDPQPAKLAGVLRDSLVLFPIASRQVNGLGLRKPEKLYYTLYRIAVVSRDGDVEDHSP